VGGNILEYLDLAKYMDEDQPFYGIQAIGLDGKRERQNLTVEEMAAHYLKEVRAFQPQGPYYIGGSSFGGLVAYEMAQQLHAAGEEVGLLAFFDTNGPAYPQYLPTATVWQKTLDRVRHRVNLHWENLRESHGRERVRYLRIKARRLGYSVVVGGQRRVRRRWRKWWARLEELFWPSAIRNVKRAGHWAARDYRAKPYPGKVTIFRATQQPRYIVEDRTLGWSGLVQGAITVYDTPGHHGAIVRDPRARVLAHQLQEAINQTAPAPPVTTSVKQLFH
jgi:thioesterase domain-containing protein